MYAHKRKLRFTSLISMIMLLLFRGNSQAVAQEAEATASATLTPSLTATFTPTETIETTSTASPEPTTNIPTLTHTNTPFAVPEIGGDYISDEVLVKFSHSNTENQASLNNCFADIAIKEAASINSLGFVVLKISSGSVSEAIARAKQCPDILVAEPNYYLYATDTFPNDPNWADQYGLTAINAPQGWDTTTGSSAVTIAIVDTGVDLTHTDLASKIVAGYDFVNNDSVPQDDNGHGTHVAGIAAAVSNNGAGIAGVSWGARIMPIKVLNASASGSFSNAAAGIVWATDHGAQIINLSLGGSADSTILRDAIDYAYQNGVTLIAASGNSGSASILYPARYPNVIAVGATDAGNLRASFSNFGAELDVVAPGVNIYSTGIGSYFYNSGTSMSTPFVSGLAAILRGIPGSGSPESIAWEIKSSALDLGIPGKDDLYGYGIIQMDAAIQLVWVTATPTSPTPEITSTEPTSPQVGSPFQGVSPNSTSTPTQTQTPSPIPAYPETTKTLLPTNDTQERTELYALSTPIVLTENPSFRAKNLSLPCLGATFIMLGSYLFWLGARLRKKN